MSPRPGEASNVDWVVYALYLLGGAQTKVYSEDIAAKAYLLAPSRFCWRLSHFRNNGWPDKYIAKTALEDAKKPEFGSLVEGAYALDVAKDGWRLTPTGIEWLNENRERMSSLAADDSEKIAAASKRDQGRFRSRILSQPLYKTFSKYGDLSNATKYDYTEMLDCSPDAAPLTLRSKSRRLRTQAMSYGFSEIASFLDACEKKFLPPDTPESIQKEPK